MILISNLTLSIKDGSTIASTEIYGVDKKTYINIGSGNVFKLSWDPFTLTNDTVDRYSLVIKRHDTTLNVYYDIFNKNIGLVNEFFVDSSLLPSVPEQYILSIYLVAYGKHGSVVTSNVINPYISKGSGTYVKVDDESYAQPIMKRALAFAKVASTIAPTLGQTNVALADSEGMIITDITGKIITTTDTSVLTAEFDLADANGTLLEDAEGNALFAVGTKILTSIDGWNVVQEGYTKDTNGTWRTNDIVYEVLQVLNENTGKYEVLLDHTNMPIYIL